jgi:hypothetical protein
MPQKSCHAARNLAWVFFSTTVLLALSLAWSWRYFYRLMPVPEAPPLPLPAAPQQISPLQVHFQLDVPGRGEIFPALESERPTDYWPLALLTISNTGDHPAIESVSAEVLGWSEPFQQILMLAPRETRKLALTPELLPRAYQNTDMRRAILRVEAKEPWADSGFSKQVPVFLHSAFDLYWGPKFQNAQLLARWVTPHDPSVLRLVSEGRAYMPGGRLRGYDEYQPNEKALEAEVRAEARALFEALRHSGLGYVSSIYTFGNFVDSAQRIRLPEETLSLRNANCIDVSVAYASMLENIGIDPLIFIVPGHAFVGLRLAPHSRDTLYLDLTVLPQGGFLTAIRRAENWRSKIPASQVLTVDISAARALGIYPMPVPVSGIQTASMPSQPSGSATPPSR